MSRSMTAGIDYTSRDYDSIREAMIAKLKEKIPEYTDTSETDMGIVLLECLAVGADIVSFYQDTQANETMLATCEQRKSALNWCNILGYTPQHTTPARVYQVFELQTSSSLSTIIPKGTVVKTVPTETVSAIKFTTEEDLEIPAGSTGIEKDSSGNYLYKVSAIHGSQVSNEVLGTSTGAKNQSFLLSYYPVVFDSVVLQVKEDDSDTWTTWTRVDNFADSNYQSNHYTLSILNNNQAQVTFGDGNTGKIPATYNSGIRVSYICGGGTGGNVSADTITLMHTQNALVKSTFNPEAVYQKGLDKESLDDIKVNAPAYNRTKWGALTVDDFSDVMKLTFEDVLYCKSKKSTSNIDDIDIFVMLRDGVSLTSTRIAEMLSVMEDRKIAGARNLNIQAMGVCNVSMQASLVVTDNYSKNTVESAVKTYLQNYFAVGNLDISQDISVTELESSVLNGVSGVRSFRITTPSDLVIEVPDGKVAELSSVSITSTGGA